MSIININMKGADIMDRSVNVNGKVINIKVINTNDQTGYISESDAEMDARASHAVKVAIEKAKICKKPVAKYDKVNKKAYLEYANGERRYAN